MANIIPESFEDLFDDKTKAFLHLATIMPNGTPQVTPVWFNRERDLILINSAEGRIKDKNMRANPNVAMEISDPNNPYRYIQLRGEVIEITKDGAIDHINLLSKKYTGREFYRSNPGNEQRVIYKIKPNKVNANG